MSLTRRGWPFQFLGVVMWDPKASKRHNRQVQLC